MALGVEAHLERRALHHALSVIAREPPASEVRRQREDSIACVLKRDDRRRDHALTESIAHLQHGVTDIDIHDWLARDLTCHHEVAVAVHTRRWVFHPKLRGQTDLVVFARVHLSQDVVEDASHEVLHGVLAAFKRVAFHIGDRDEVGADCIKHIVVDWRWSDFKQGHLAQELVVASAVAPVHYGLLQDRVEIARLRGNRHVGRRRGVPRRVLWLVPWMENEGTDEQVDPHDRRATECH